MEKKNNFKMSLNFLGKLFCKSAMTSVELHRFTSTEDLAIRLSPSAQKTSTAIEEGLSKSLVGCLVHLATMEMRMSDCFAQTDVMKEVKKYANQEHFLLIMVMRLLHGVPK